MQNVLTYIKAFYSKTEGEWSKLVGSTDLPAESQMNWEFLLQNQ